MVKSILKKKNKVLILPDFKTQHKDTIIKTVWHCQKTDLQTTEQNTGPRNTLSQIWSNDLQQEC